MPQVDPVLSMFKALGKFTTFALLASILIIIVCACNGVGGLIALFLLYL